MKMTSSTSTSSESVGVWSVKQSWQTVAPEAQFWVAIDIFVNRPHIVNRRLIGCEVLGEIPVKSCKLFEEIKHQIFSVQNESEIQELIMKEKSNQSEQSNHSVACIRKVLPKNKSLQSTIEIVLKDQVEEQVSFFSKNQDKSALPSFPYAFSYDEVGATLSLLTDSRVDDSDSGLQWIIKKAVPKLLRWMETVVTPKTGDSSSLRLVSVPEYSALYNKLKDTYGKQLVQIWPENTNPLKFVYEDIGIAAYLLLLWAGKPKQRFVDLGCGNGLLVHILNSEGHLGVGYDIRARKIWALYPPSTKLEIRTIFPSESQFPDADWLIGNHSDELTVWLPVMAAQSSYSCNIFLLPCCPFEFDGRKYCRVNTCVSQYEDFLSYVKTVCESCGFVTERDKLRIPSTRRTCFVSKARTYEKKDWKENVCRVQTLVESKCTVNTESGETICGFKPRAEERVRNCTKVHADVLQTVVNIVADQLLAKKRLSAQGWNCGAVLEISSLAKVIPRETLKMLKNECGGLQTLLKNHRHIFLVQSGKVQFRVPTQKTESESIVWKKKPCWFDLNHPNKCPVPDAYCSFRHGAEESDANS